MQKVIKKIDKSTNLIKPTYWNDLSTEEKLNAYNGVGPEFFPKWLRQLLDSVLMWAQEAVIIHDVEYSYSAWRVLADVKFLINLLYLSKKRTNKKKDNIAKGLFLAVFFCGKKAWKASRIKK